MSYLIEESAVKEYYAYKPGGVPKKLWRWLLDDGPIIRAEPLATMPGGKVRFRLPQGGLIDIPRDALSEDFNDEDN